MSSNLQRDGDGDWVAAYGSPAISRPNSLSFHGSGTWAVGSRSPYRKSGEWAGGVGDEGGDEGDYGDEAAGGQGREGSDEDAPPAAIPPEELPKLAREAAEWDFAAVLQRRHSPRRRLAALFVYALALGALTVGTWFVPCLELKSDSLVVDYLDTDCLPWSSFALWMALLLAGFTYVSFWTCGRDNPFQGPSRTYYDVLLLIPAGCVLFFLGPVYTIASEIKPTMVGAELTARLLGMNLNNFGFSVLYNYCFYVLPFLVGLQYSHLEKLKVFNRLGTKLSTGYWLRLTCAELGALALVVLFLIPFLGFHLWLLYLGDWFMMLLFVIVYGVFVTLLYLIGLAGLWHNRFRFSMHHYFVAAFLIPWTCFFNPISAVLQALLAGIFTEGVSRWSFARLFRSIPHERRIMLYLDWVKHEHSDFLSDYSEELTRYEVLGRAF